jgi:hypothetical protein
VNNFIFNILQKAKQVRDFVLTQGPAALDSTAEGLKRFAEFISVASQFLKTYPGQVVAGKNLVDHDDPRLADDLAELRQIRDELAGAADQPKHGTAPTVGGTPLPDHRATVASDAMSYIDEVLAKAGRSNRPEPDRRPKPAPKPSPGT